jgi:hypothetical protein
VLEVCLDADPETETAWSSSGSFAPRGLRDCPFFGEDPEASLEVSSDAWAAAAARSEERGLLQEALLRAGVPDGAGMLGLSAYQE